MILESEDKNKANLKPLLQAMRDCFGGHMFELENFNEKIHADWLE